jgi:cell wall assembly regulator SMI1
MPSQESYLREEVVSLMKEVKPLGDHVILRPATESQITAFEQKFHLEIPTELREWLLFTNGANVNPGGFLGVEEFGKYYEWHPNWWSNNWIPVASDGCGNNWVLSCGELILSGQTHPVLFLDQSDVESPAYIVASGLWQFLRFVFEDEIIHQKFPPALDTQNEGWYERMQQRLRDPNRKDYWPFTKDKVLQKDPCMNDYTGAAPFPWDLEE